ncbi:MAG: hypothetical protein KC451_14030, partial [Amylibacter sp.]|nr:hypothetical protein [Amylibacter sp.]
ENHVDSTLGDFETVLVVFFGHSLPYVPPRRSWPLIDRFAYLSLGFSQMPVAVKLEMPDGCCPHP